MDIIQEALKEVIKKSEGTINDLVTEEIRKRVHSDVTQSTVRSMITEIYGQPRLIEITLPDGKTSKVDGITHRNFELLVRTVTCKVPVLMVGAPGTGKTTAGMKVAELLGVDFHGMSVSSQTTKVDLLGYMDATGNYQTTPFRRSFEDGGVFILDEVDAGNPNVLTTLNSAISNGFCEFPDAKILAHPEFRLVATANTTGRGADHNFVGRNRLDAATLDRFVIIEWDIDEEVERLLCPNTLWHETVITARKWVIDRGVDKLVTSRALIYGCQLLSAGVDPKTTVEVTILSGLNANDATALGQYLSSNVQKLVNEEKKSKKEVYEAKKAAKKASKVAPDTATL